MIQVSQLKRWNIINFKNNYYLVQDKTLHWTARGAWLITLKIKDVFKEQTLTETFRDKEVFELMSLEKRNWLYLYSDWNNLYFLDLNTNETITFKEFDFKEELKFLQENNEYSLRVLNNTYIDFIIPEILIWKIIETDDITNWLFQQKKNAILEGNILITGPHHMKKWDLIKYNSKTLEYKEKV